MADRAIGELDAVTESPISGLPEVLELYDETLIPVEQQGAAHKMSGKQFRQFGEKTAEAYVNTAKDAAASAADSASLAKRDADRAQELRDGIELDYDYIENARLEAQQSARQAKESENAAKSSQAAAGDSAAAAAAGAAVIEENAGAIRAIEDNLEAVQYAAENALAAAGSAASAALDAQRAEEFARQAQSISQGALGYYPNAETLVREHPDGENGQWAIVGQTDTIWIWDGDTSSWSDSGNKTDLSNYYTIPETDERLALKADSAQMAAALDGKVDKEAGKVLSSNDYTAAEKSKLAGIAAGAQVNSVTSVNGLTGAVNLTAASVGALASNVRIGGRNLVLKSSTQYSTTAYRINRYELAQPLEAGKTYTCTIWGNLTGGKTTLDIYTATAQSALARMTRADDGCYRGTFTVEGRHYSTADDLKILQVYASPESVTGVTSTINRIKLEAGSVSTDWSPAAEDYLPLTGGTLSDTVISTTPTALRSVFGDYGVMLHNNGSSYYILLTNRGDPYGDFNSLRPFQVNFTNGEVMMSSGTCINGYLRLTSNVYGTSLPAAGTAGRIFFLKA